MAPTVRARPGTMINNILDRTLHFFQDPVNRDKIQSQFIDPLLKHILDRMFPYIILTCIIFCLILLMSLTSVGLMIFQLHAHSKPVTALTEAVINQLPE